MKTSDHHLQSFDENGGSGHGKRRGEVRWAGDKNIELKHLEPMLPAAHDANLSAS